MHDVIEAQRGGTIHMGNSVDAMNALNGDKTFDLVVFCAQEFGPPVIAMKPGEVQKRRTRIYFAPMDDANLTQKEVFIASRAANLIATSFLKRKRILVTCMQGRNRSGLVVAMALDLLSSEGGAAALAAVRERRIHAGAPALTNPSFVKFLQSIPPRATGPRAIVLGTGPRQSLVL